VVFNIGPYTVLPDNSILITGNMQSETGFPSSHQLKSYIASKSRLKVAARCPVSGCWPSCFRPSSGRMALRHSFNTSDSLSGPSHLCRLAAHRRWLAQKRFSAQHVRRRTDWPLQNQSMPSLNWAVATTQGAAEPGDWGCQRGLATPDNCLETPRMLLPAVYMCESYLQWENVH